MAHKIDAVLNTPLTLTIETQETVAGASTIQLAYEKPDGTTGTWDASGSGTTLVCNIPENELDTLGVWRVAGKAIFGSNTIANYTRSIDIKVHSPFDV